MTRRWSHPTGSTQLAALLASVLSLALLATACGGGSSEGASGAATRFVAGSGAVTTVPEDKRKPAPELSGETLGGRTISLDDYKGSVVVLNVWGSWCPPCRKEAPELAKAARKLEGKGVEFLGIDTRDNNPAPARAFVERFDIPYPSLYDPDGRLLLGFSGTIPPSAIPSTLVIDQQGRVAARILGESTSTTFVQLARDVRDGR